MRYGTLLQLENVVRLFERRTRWKVGRRVEASRCSLGGLVHLSENIGEGGG